MILTVQLDVWQSYSKPRASGDDPVSTWAAAFNLE